MFLNLIGKLEKDYTMSIWMLVEVIRKLMVLCFNQNKHPTGTYGISVAADEASFGILFIQVFYFVMQVAYR